MDPLDLPDTRVLATMFPEAYTQYTTQTFRSYAWLKQTGKPDYQHTSDAPQGFDGFVRYVVQHGDKMMRIFYYLRDMGFSLDYSWYLDTCVF